VPLSVQIGVVMALITALMSILGFLLKHRGSVAAPDVEWRHPLRSTIDLFRSPIYAIGCVVATTSWGFHVAALALAPISVVQAVIAGGLVLLTIVADRVFGHEVSRREWFGVALVAIGLAFLAATLEGTADEAHSGYATGTLAGYIGLATVAGMALVPLARLRAHDGIVLAVSAGLLWGGSDVAIKALSDHTHDGLAVLVHPLAFVILILSLVGLLVSARSLQLGPAVPVIAVTSATANVFTIASGPIVFGEPMPEEPFAVAVRLLAFVLVIGAAALTPPPLPARAPSG
jgi:multidrug transporter EmrE-like cation transporter